MVWTSEWKWRFTSKTEKKFARLEKETQRRVVSKLDFWVSTGRPFEYAERLVDFRYGEYRFRVGDYRILFEVRENVIWVLEIGHRREIYK